MKDLIATTVEMMDAGADEQRILEVLGHDALKPFIQEGDFGTISVLVRVLDAAKNQIIERDVLECGYRGFNVDYLPKPIPSRKMDYDWTHESYDGPEDYRLGCAASVKECMEAIDEYWLENPEEVIEEAVTV